jgi:hypothetical protein
MQKMEKPMAKQESAKALASYKQQQAQFKNPPPKVDTAGSGAAVNNIRNTTVYRPGSTYIERRTVFYGGYTPPMYMYGFAPHYGVWDAMFMFWMLDHASHHNTFYHQQNDPGFQAWRQEANKQAETNAELREKLARMDEKVKQMEKEGVKRDPSYVPEEAKSVALHEEAATKNIPVKKDEGGFPWFWTIVILACVVGGIILLKRRSS